MRFIRYKNTGHLKQFRFTQRLSVQDKIVIAMRCSKRSPTYDAIRALAESLGRAPTPEEARASIPNLTNQE